MQNEENLRNKIVQELKRKDMKAEYVWPEKEIIFFVSGLLLFERDIFDMVINEMINEGIFVLKNNGLQLTKKGEKIIY